jgi:hypothetical protein
MSRLVNLAARCWPAALVLLAACGASAGGGGVQTIGGPVGSVCDTQYQKEGCNGLDRMQCVLATGGATATSGTWQKIATCTQGSQYCLESADTTNPQLRVTECKEIPQQVADVISGADISTNQDGVTLPDVNQQQVVACVQQKCATQYNACLSNAGCKASVNCNLACSGNEACEDKCPTANIEDPVVAALFGCIFDSGCIPEVPDTICGDTICEGDETMGSCPQDCKTAGPVCGNETCESGETAQSCPSDCKTAGPVCGNGTCESGETTQSCPGDCKTSGPICGNETCEEGETKQNCAIDCGSPGPVCFNEVCEEGENWETCPSDCQKPVVCGDKVCEGNETPSNCPGDCKTTAKCGDGTCASGETTTTCAMDCATTQYGATIQCGWDSCNSAMKACGNKPACVEALNCLANCKCDQACAENKCSSLLSGAINELSGIYSCAESAGCPTPCPDAPVCGDGTCNGTETKTSCPDDCGTTSNHVCDSACGNTYTDPKSGSTCYCDASCKTQSSPDCCNSAGTAKASSCSGSTCSECK